MRIHVKLGEPLWRSVGQHGLALDWPRVKVYQDGMPDTDPALVAKILAEVHSPNYELVRWLVAQGAELVGTESTALHILRIIQEESMKENTAAEWIHSRGKGKRPPEGGSRPRRSRRAKRRSLWSPGTDLDPGAVLQLQLAVGHYLFASLKTGLDDGGRVRAIRATTGEHLS